MQHFNKDPKLNPKVDEKVFHGWDIEVKPRNKEARKKIKRSTSKKIRKAGDKEYYVCDICGVEFKAEDILQCQGNFICTECYEELI
jgi:transcription initiation factor IIE alpha subunit